ncbi:MAG: hypothetical protein O9312_15730 [Hylemonella sp.]|nr:hypothetical protein [Hylemonella sp.]
MKFQMLNRGVMAVLIGLLALAPFLHGHLGASHVSGFHLDGVHAVAHSNEAGSALGMRAVDDESPALGVATSLPKPDDDSKLLLQAALLLAAVLGLLPRLVLLRIRPSAAEPRTVHAYHDGWPPPALAPPLLTA